MCLWGQIRHLNVETCLCAAYHLVLLQGHLWLKSGCWGSRLVVGTVEGRTRAQAGAMNQLELSTWIDRWGPGLNRQMGRQSGESRQQIPTHRQQLQESTACTAQRETHRDRRWCGSWLGKQVCNKCQEADEGNEEQVSRCIRTQEERPGTSSGQVKYDRGLVNRAETEIMRLAVVELSLFFWKIWFDAFFVVSFSK